MSQLILASQSPRRKKLLTEAGISFACDFVNLSEKLRENLSLAAAVEDLAEQKSRAFLAHKPQLKSRDVILLSADTVVAIEGRVLGKPNDREEAFAHLSLLSGTQHQVITGVCFLNCLDLSIDRSHEITQVSFKNLSEQEIWSYIETGEPMDKAGSYGIQGLGKNLVQGYQGSWTNVVGLPMELVKQKILDHGWVFE